jgi:hypothetical protein
MDRSEQQNKYTRFVAIALGVFIVLLVLLTVLQN